MRGTPSKRWTARIGTSTGSSPPRLRPPEARATDGERRSRSLAGSARDYFAAALTCSSISALIRFNASSSDISPAIVAQDRGRRIEDRAIELVTLDLGGDGESFEPGDERSLRPWPAGDLVSTPFFATPACADFRCAPCIRRTPARSPDNRENDRRPGIWCASTRRTRAAGHAVHADGPQGLGTAIQSVLADPSVHRRICQLPERYITTRPLATPERVAVARAAYAAPDFLRHRAVAVPVVEFFAIAR